MLIWRKLSVAILIVGCHQILAAGVAVENCFFTMTIVATTTMLFADFLQVVPFLATHRSTIRSRGLVWRQEGDDAVAETVFRLCLGSHAVEPHSCYEDDSNETKHEETDNPLVHK